MLASIELQDATSYLFLSILLCVVFWGFRTNSFFPFNMKGLLFRAARPKYASHAGSCNLSRESDVTGGTGKLGFTAGFFFEPQGKEYWCCMQGDSEQVVQLVHSKGLSNGADFH